MSTPTIGELVIRGGHDLRQAGIQAGRSEAELIIAFVLNEDKSYVLAHNDFHPSQAQAQRIQNLLDLRVKRLPMSYVLGEREFYARTFKVDGRALTPRIETEIIVQQATKTAPKAARILDIGTGCGAIGISIKLERPDTTVILTDISKDALELAQENLHNLLPDTTEVSILSSDLFSDLTGPFNVIAANLPYVSRDADLMPEVQKEPTVALFGGSGDGLDLYRRFFADLRQYLAKNGYVYLESDPWQQPALTELAAAQGLRPIFQDYFILGFQLTAE